MDTMPKKMPALTGIKKAELVAMFKQLWDSAYKLSQAIAGHHANAEGLLNTNEELRKHNKRLEDKIDWLEDRIVALSASTAKQHNKTNYGIRQRKKARRVRNARIKSYFNASVSIFVLFCCGWLIWKSLALFEVTYSMGVGYMLGQLLLIVFALFAI